jgi:hypothetical protein
MTVLADSNAFFNMERLLVQHQAALTLLQGMLSDPNCHEISWLDLGCGRGQIISHLEKNLSATERSKIKLVGYDIENTYSIQAKGIAKSLELSSYSFEIGTLSRFWENRSTAGPWRFITLTNTIHEIAPKSLSEILARCIERLDNDGCLFMYDMEKLPVPELGAIPWSASEMKAILITLFRALGCSSFEPAVGTWTHKTCTGWNAQIRRSHMGLPTNFPEQLDEAIYVTSLRIEELLLDRLTRVDAALKSLAEYGPDTGQEMEDKESLLYEFWAVSRALGEK